MHFLISYFYVHIGRYSTEKGSLSHELSEICSIETSQNKIEHSMKRFILSRLNQISFHHFKAIKLIDLCG